MLHSCQAEQAKIPRIFISTFRAGPSAGKISEETDKHYRMSSDSLLDRAQKLDARALAAIHDRYYPAVYRYIRYRLDNEQMVEDLSSEVFLRLLDHLHRQKGPINDLRAWLLGTSANLVNDHLRQKYRRPQEVLDNHERLPSTDNPESQVEQNDSHREVREAMQKLTNEQQHVLALRFSQGLSLEETAQVLEKTTGAIKVLQFRALATLRKLLSKSVHLM